MVVEGGVFLLILDTGNVTVYSRLVAEMCFLLSRLRKIYYV